MGAGDELDREIDEHYREKLREPGPGPDPGAAGAPAELRTRDGRTQEELDREMEEYFMKDSKSAKATLDNGLDDYFKSKDAEKEEGEVEKAG